MRKLAGEQVTVFYNQFWFKVKLRTGGNTFAKLVNALKTLLAD